MDELQEELKVQAAKHAEKKAAWEKEREEWLVERKRLGSWKVRCLDSERKLNEKIYDMKINYD